MSKQHTLEVADSLGAVTPAEWDRLAGPNPLVSHAFLHALHESGSAAPDAGWAPQYLLLREANALVAALPLYLKSHSYGEYVFDWAWADAWQRAGRRYYPKLLSAIPFTPVTGPRLLAARPEYRSVLAEAAKQFAQELEVSTLHCLFPTEDEAAELAADGFMLRKTVQFHWTNEGYADFDDFLSRMNHEKRKKVKQERRRVREAGVEYEWKVGRAITEADWRFFVRCYDNTYREHHSSPYLNLDFFLRIGTAMPDNLLLVIGRQDGKPLCASLDVFTPEALWGRYWGTLGFVSGLHFETCYYQAIEFCIANRIGAFEGGAQGEHKLARGLMPVTTWSAHWVADPDFARAIQKFLERESHSIGNYVNELEEHTPFKPTETPNP
jgi:predicted N-acyltransferase